MGIQEFTKDIEPFLFAFCEDITRTRLKHYEGERRRTIKKPEIEQPPGMVTTSG